MALARAPVRKAQALIPLATPSSLCKSTNCRNFTEIPQFISLFVSHTHSANLTMTFSHVVTYLCTVQTYTPILASFAPVRL